MIYCTVFQEDVTQLNAEEMKARCEHCLEKTPGPLCNWLELMEDQQIPEPHEDEIQNQLSDDLS